MRQLYVNCDRAEVASRIAGGYHLVFSSDKCTPQFGMLVRDCSPPPICHLMDEPLPRLTGVLDSTAR